MKTKPLADINEALEAALLAFKEADHLVVTRITLVQKPNGTWRVVVDTMA